MGFLKDRFILVTVRCKGCGGRIRFPVNKGKIRVTCPHCRAWFVFSLHPAIMLDLAIQVAAEWLRGLPALARFNRQPWLPDAPVKKRMLLIFLLALLLVILINLCGTPGQ